MDRRVQPVLPHLSQEEDVKELITVKESTVAPQSPQIFGFLAGPLPVRPHTAPAAPPGAVPASVLIPSLPAERGGQSGGTRQP